MFKIEIVCIKPMHWQIFVFNSKFFSKQTVTSPCFRSQQFLCTYLQIEIVFAKIEVLNIYLVTLVTFHSSHKHKKLQQVQCLLKLLPLCLFRQIFLLSSIPHRGIYFGEEMVKKLPQDLTEYKCQQFNKNIVTL